VYLSEHFLFMTNHPEIVTLRRPAKSLDASVVLPSSKSISNRLLIIRALSYYSGVSGSQGLPGDRNAATGDHQSTGSSNAPRKTVSDTHLSDKSEAWLPEKSGEKGASGPNQPSSEGSELIPDWWLNAIKNLSDSDDTAVMIKALTSVDPLKDIGHAGTSMRFLTAYYCTQPGRTVMTGSPRMKQRPVGPLVDALRILGADIQYIENEGFPPLEINGSADDNIECLSSEIIAEQKAVIFKQKGKDDKQRSEDGNHYDGSGHKGIGHYRPSKNMKGGAVSIDGSISSQFISALLMIGPVLEKGIELHLTGDIVSEAYIRMTLQLMKSCGAVFSREGNVIRVEPGGYGVAEFTVESDWSAASYWYAMALLEDHSRVTLRHLDEDSLQGDSELTNIFHKLGVVSDFTDRGFVLTKLVNLHPGRFEHDFTNTPDLVQAMAVALCLAKIPFRFTGTQTLRIKETDRIAALQQELKKLGYLLESDERGSFLAWDSKHCDPAVKPVIETYHDHRMAMAFAPAALVRGEIRIADPMVVTKSYPDFWEDMETAGFKMTIESISPQ